MRRVSIKRQKQREEYKPIRLEYLQAHEFCELCQENPSQEIHHKRGTNGDRLNDNNFFMAVCRPCHVYIENNRAWSYANGYLIKRNNK